MECTKTYIYHPKYLNPKNRKKYPKILTVYWPHPKKRLPGWMSVQEVDILEAFPQKHKGSVIST